ncbi:hypothetical protein UMC2_37671 [[Clostridium] sordellii]|nr:hypothetical protein [Paeniclostridium sordellii]CEK34556.1 hypothetical protein UMC2_37671 [[Clostridium] sordellii] [Paeniclostridium sordellii]
MTIISRERGHVGFFTSEDLKEEEKKKQSKIKLLRLWKSIVEILI